MSYVFASASQPITNDESKTQTVTEAKIIYEFGNLETLIERLGKIRASTNGYINVSISGNGSSGYRITCSWERPMTEEESERALKYKTIAEEAAKEMRREEYQKLKAEFDNGG